MKSKNPRVSLYKEAMALEDKRGFLQTQLENVLGRLTAIKDALFHHDEPVKGKVSKKPVAGKRGRTPRGELKAQIVEALQSAGKAGVKVRELAHTIGTKLPNVHAWFQNAKKQIPALKKVGPGHYRLEGELPAPKKTKKTAKAVKTKGAVRRGKQTGKRGELAGRIVAALEKAGSEGAKVRDLAVQLNVNPKNLYIWFATTGKKNRSIKKIGEAHYRLT